MLKKIIGIYKRITLVNLVIYSNDQPTLLSFNCDAHRDFPVSGHLRGEIVWQNHEYASTACSLVASGIVAIGTIALNSAIGKNK